MPNLTTALTLTSQLTFCTGWHQLLGAMACFSQLVKIQWCFHATASASVGVVNYFDDEDFYDMDDGFYNVKVISDDGDEMLDLPRSVYNRAHVHPNTANGL